MPIIRRPFVRPRGERHHRAFREKAALAEKIVNGAATGVTPTAETRRPQSYGDKCIIDGLQLGSNNVRRQIVQEGGPRSWDYAGFDRRRIPRVDVHANFNGAVDRE